MIQSEIDFTPETGSEIIGQIFIFWTPLAMPLKAESSFFLLFGPALRPRFERMSGETFPEHEDRDADVNDDRDHAHDVIDVARAFQMLDQLRADLRAARSCRWP